MYQDPTKVNFTYTAGLRDTTTALLCRATHISIACSPFKIIKKQLIRSSPPGNSERDSIEWKNGSSVEHSSYHKENIFCLLVTRNVFQMARISNSSYFGALLYTYLCLLHPTRNIFYFVTSFFKVSCSDIPK